MLNLEEDTMSPSQRKDITNDLQGHQSWPFCSAVGIQWTSAGSQRQHFVCYSHSLRPEEGQKSEEGHTILFYVLLSAESRT